MKKKVQCEIPAVLGGEVELSDVYQNHSAAGNPTSFGVDLELPELGLHRDIKSKDFHLLKPKIESTLATWAKKYERHLEVERRQARAESVDELNEELSERLDSLNGLLEHTLSIDDTVDWESLKRRDSCRAKPEEYLDGVAPRDQIAFSSSGRPTGIIEIDVEDEPTFETVRSDYGFLSRLFRKSAIEADLERRLDSWRQSCANAEAETSGRRALLEKVNQAFERAKLAFDDEKARANDHVAQLSTRYSECDPAAIEEYCEIVLQSSQYPDEFPQSWTLEYRPEGEMLLVDYDLPAPDHMPSVESYRYVKARDEVSEKVLSPAARKKLYESVIYQICIRTLHELFESDTADALKAAVFNGCVTSVNPGTGVTEEKTILSVLAEKEAFETFDLSQVDPKATFKHLKGVAAAALVDLAPIPPVVMLNKSDKRFIDGKAIVSALSEEVNIAVMDWEDFEHLVRELFEKEFTGGGGEVRVTQASADGGVDAVAFDPDPIRGGKIVIQAKRYSNTVGVAAVRDLYGTVMNEGATKGILVTTSDYGKDSYEFAKDKPLTLLNGGNLLALLQKHGHKARINIAEAKAALKKS